MSVEFRSRIPSAVDYKTILNYGICCQGITKIESDNYTDCYNNKDGFFVIGDPEDELTECPKDHI